MEKTSFEGDLQIEKVISLLSDFKQAIYNVNYLNKLITQHADEIYENRDEKNGKLNIMYNGNTYICEKK